MITDPVPRKVEKLAEYKKSDAMKSLAIPSDGRFQALAIETALSSGLTAVVRAACTSFISEAARFYGVPPPPVRVLAARPLRVHGIVSKELFGDYDLRTAQIRVWMRTAVHHRVTSFGAFLSTLCHEFCHHLDLHLFGFPSTPHTRGFYNRTAVLYHCCRGTPLRKLYWCPYGKGCWRIDWAKMR